MKLNVLLVSDQVRGIDGTGGLGDVATGLAKALAEREDVDIRLVMPGYQQISEKGHENRFDKVVIDSLPVPYGDRTVNVKVCQVTLPTFSPDEKQVICYLLVEPELFQKRHDSGAQSVLLARATLAFVDRFSDFRPDLIHCNDWHTALIPVYINSLYRDHPFLGRLATLYTIHNNTGAAYQGVKPLGEVAPLAGLPGECYVPGASRSLEFWGQVNHAKGGIGYSDLINTVSLTYANELRSGVFGGGLEGSLQDRDDAVCGIVNGIDCHEWDPATDKYLPASSRFSPGDNPAVIVEKKWSLRQPLRNWLSARKQQPFENISEDTVLIGVVTRISDQKMPVLLPLPEDTGLPHELVSPLERLCQLDGASGWPKVQWVILGSAHPDDTRGQSYIRKLEQLQQKYPEQVTFFNGFDIGLSHLVYAACDMFVVPSSFEPCGLTQLTSLRYGTVPVVRGVGGLKDTIIDEQFGVGANGFRFCERTDDVLNWQYPAEVPAAAELLFQTLCRALRVYQQPGRWRQLMVAGLQRDSSWTVPAAQYRRLYDEAVRRHLTPQFCRTLNLRSIEYRLHEFTQWFERLLTLPASVFANLCKFNLGQFGPYEMTTGFRAELLTLWNWSLIGGPHPDQVPPRGENLSHHLHITQAGLDFIRLRQALAAAANPV